jgi:arginine-tRNA-protein transferase
MDNAFAPPSGFQIRMTEPSTNSAPPDGAHEPPVSTLEECLHLGDVPDVCPYLPDRIATFRLIHGLLAAPAYERLLDAGFRRSGNAMYRPACRTCAECRPLRVPVREFRRSKSQRRVWNRCEPRFNVEFGPPSADPPRPALYTAYRRYQHGETGDGPDDAAEDYRGFLVDSCLGGRTMEVRYVHGGRLAGVGIVDRLEHALSTVYFYFDPAFADYSLGTFSALYEIELARRWGMRHYYLGYYIAPCASMNYKARYRPCEIRTADGTGWERLEA